MQRRSNCSLQSRGPLLCDWKHHQVSLVLTSKRGLGEWYKGYWWLGVKLMTCFMIHSHHFSLISVCELPSCNIVPWVEKKKNGLKKVSLTRISKETYWSSEQYLYGCFCFSLTYWSVMLPYSNVEGGT